MQTNDNFEQANAMQEEAYVIHRIQDIDDIIQEFGAEIVIKNLSDYAREQIVRYLAKTY